jgi:hypothetical protein
VAGFKTLTLKSGFIAGAIVGLGAWAFVHGYLVFVPAPTIAAGSLTIFAGILVIAAVLMGIASAFKGSSAFGTTGDGFIYGFVTIFEIFWIIGTLASGYLPVP